MGRTRPKRLSPVAAHAVSLLSAQIRLARTERRMSQVDLAERVGVSQPTIQRLEHGDPAVGLGIAFEAAAIVGLPLFHPDPDRVRVETSQVRDRLAVLPAAVRTPRQVDDDF